MEAWVQGKAEVSYSPLFLMAVMENGRHLGDEYENVVSLFGRDSREDNPKIIEEPSISITK